MFVPNGKSRTETAILLVGTAREYGIDQREIRATATGFHISDRLAELVYPEPKKSSGNRAAKGKKSTATNKE